MGRKKSPIRRSDPGAFRRPFFLPAVFCVSFFRAFRERRRLLPRRDFDGRLEGSFGLGFIGPNASKKHSTEPMEFGKALLVFSSFVIRLPHE